MRRRCFVFVLLTAWTYSSAQDQLAPRQIQATLRQPVVVGTITFRPQANTGTCNLNFTYTLGQSLPAAQVCAVTTSSAVAFTVSVSQTWIHVNPSSGTLSVAPTNLSVSVDPSGKSAGTYSGTYTISGPALAPSTNTVTLVVIQGGSSPLSIITSSLPSATQGISYSYGLSATGGAPPYSWFATGSLPAGLALSSSGNLSGTPSASGIFTVPVQVTDSARNSINRSLSLAIGTGSTPLSINAIGTINTTVGQALSAIQLSASGGSPPYAWSASGLPAGVNFSTSGVISGTPAQTGNVTARVQVTDSKSAVASTNVPFAIAREGQSLTGSCNARFTYTTGQASPSPQICDISTALSADFTISVSAPWLLISPLAGTFGPNLTALTISVNPAGLQPNTYTATFTISGPLLNPSQSTVTLVVISDLSIVTTSPLPSGSVGRPYTAVLTAAGGTAPYSWGVVSGGLPAGLALSGAAFVGVPSAAGAVAFSLRVTDAIGSTSEAAFSLTVSPPAQSLSVSTPSLPPATLNGSYSQPLQGTGGYPPYSWTVSAGNLPPGLTISGGFLLGAPTSSGNFFFSVTVNDAAGGASTSSYFLAVNSGLSIDGVAPINDVIGQAISPPVQVGASNGAPPYRWVGAGFPRGTAISDNGLISGIPQQPGSFDGVVTVTDSGGNRQSTAVHFNVGTPAFSSVSYWPHLADGNDGAAVWSTEMLLTNSGNSPVVFAATFHANAAISGSSTAQLPGLQAAGGQFTIPANGSYYFSTRGDSGSAYVTGWMEVDATGPLGGQAVVRRAMPNAWAETALGLIQPLTVFSFAYDLSARSGNQADLLYAISNPASDTRATVDCRLDDLGGGAVLASGGPAQITISVDPGDQSSARIDPKFYGRQGVANCTSTLPVLPVVLRALGTQSLARVPISGSN